MYRFVLFSFGIFYYDKIVSPERLAVMREATKLMLAYMPYIAHVHPIDVDLSHARVQYLIRHPFKSSWWDFTDLAAPG